MAANIDSAGALDGAAEAALINYIMLLGKGFTVDLFKLIILAVVIVLGGEETAHLHTAHKSRSAEAGKLVTGEGMVAEIFEPLLAPGCGLFLIVDGNFVVAADGYGLQVFPTQHGAHAGASASALFAHNGGIKHKVFACRSYADAAEMGSLIPSSRENIRKGVLGFRGFHSPKGICVMENKLIVMYLQPCMLGASSLYDKSIHARSLEIITEAAAAVGAGDYSRLGGEGGEIKAA